MMSPKSRSRSQSSDFARALKSLLDDTQFYTRAQWSTLLSVTTPALSQWVNDRTLPRAELLSMVLDLLKTRGGAAAREPLDRFDALLKRPATAISPHGARMGATLDVYLSKGSILDYARSLRGLPPAVQEAAIQSGAWPGPAAEVEPVGELIPSDAKNIFGGYEPANSNDGFWPVTRFVRDGVRGGSPAAAMRELLDAPRVVIHGGPGSGKSTSLMMFHQALERMNIPVARIALRTCTPLQLNQWLQIHLSGVEEGAVLFDGLDEMVAVQRAEAATMIARALEHAQNKRALVTSRAVPELELLSSFERFSIAPLTDIDLVAALTGAVSQADQLAPLELDRFLCHLAEREELRQPMRNRMLLKRAWSLFEQSAVTPFWEADIIRECATVLLEWDQSKGLNRVREPWASPHQLFNLLGQLSYRSLRKGTDYFDRADLIEWASERIDGVSADRVLDLLQIKGLIVDEQRCFRFTYRAMRDYFAAQYAVESADSATRYLDAWRTQPKLRGPLRIACSIANDATPILRSVLDSADQTADTYLLVADILAQPLTIDRNTLDEVCSSLVAWLSRQTVHWVRDRDGCHENSADPAWALVMRTDSGLAKQAEIRDALRSVHRARSGPACIPLKEHMARSQSAFLPAFADALDIEGRLNVSFVEANSIHTLRVAVEGPQLS